MSIIEAYQPVGHGYLKPSRRASVLVCVLVTLLVTGLLIAQSYHLLVAASKTQSQMFQSEQGRELLLLGKQLIEQRVQRNPLYSGESIVVQLGNQSDSTLQTAKIVIARSPAGSTPMTRWDLAISFPADSSTLFTANWETQSK